jgi:quercetin dioxygenase-like cupin family protein
MKIHSNFRIFAATNFDPSKYIASPAYGVNRFMLDRIGEEKARATTIVEYRPNSKFPEHTHIGGEEFLVLEGTFKDQFGEFPTGTYVRNPIGSKHAPWVDEDGCTIMVKLLQMADTREGTDPLHVDVDRAKTERGTATDYGTVLELYSNEQTGEQVQMCWLDANKSFTVDDRCRGGEELFVVTGSLFLGNEERYQKWGWLRFPVDGDERRSQLRAGSEGAQVYRKTGHLTDGALSMEKIQIDVNEKVVVQ